MSAKLTLKQARFVERYLVHANATQAAREAAYSGSDATLAVTGSRLLKNDKVGAAIRRGRKRETKRNVMDRDEREDLFTAIARGEGTAVALTRLGPVELPPDFKERMRAAELLGKMHGDYTEHVKTEHVGPVVHVICTPEERRERLKKGSR